VIDIEIALLQQFLDIAQRERIAKIPPDRTKYEAGFGLPPFEDRGPGYHFAILSRHQPEILKVATHPCIVQVLSATADAGVGGSMPHLQGHHLELRSQSLGDQEQNLITLCAECHERMHRKPA
jgi:cytochrome c553